MSYRHPAIDLVNSEHIHGPDDVEDELGEPQWLERFTRRWHLEESGSKAELARLRSLRGVLRVAVAELTARQTLSNETLEALNAFVLAVPVRSVLARGKDGRLILAEESARPPGASAAVAQAFEALVADEGWRRLKLCANEHCRWAFYDESRNRSRRWCDSAECGNVMKVRAFRERQRASSER